LLESNKQKSPYDTTYELLPPDQRLREKDLPAGLRNIGSTCYFNSLLQVYYSMPHFVETILEFSDGDIAAAQDIAA
jgi:ubiquitin C-terminal hydrolase